MPFASPERSDNTHNAQAQRSAADALLRDAQGNNDRANRALGTWAASSATANVEAAIGLPMKAGELVMGALNWGGHAVMQGVRELGRENPEIAGANQRIADFAQTRPATYAAEMAMNPGIATLDGLVRGGLPRQSHDAPAAPQTHPAEAQPVRHEQPQPAPHEQPQPARHEQSANPAAEHHTAKVHNGDGYWRMAQRILGDGASNRAIANMMKHLEQKNGNRMLHTGDQIQY